MYCNFGKVSLLPRLVTVDHANVTRFVISVNILYYQEKQKETQGE